MQTLGARILDTVMPRARKNEADSGGELVDTRGRVLPLRSTHLRVAAGQGIARVVLEQRFVNPHDEILDVTYRMPLPPEGAVSGYAFTFADEKVEGVVRPRAEAREAFERAIVEGRTAGLLDQERPNIFTQRLGNIPKRTELTATITIDMPLTWLPEGAWELRFPTVIGPRYTSAGPNADTIAKEVGIQVSTSALVNRAHVEIHLRDSLVSGALPESPSHTLAPFDARESVVRFVNEEGERLDRDLVVRWRVATPEVGLTLATARPEARTPHGHDAYGIVTLTPPRKKASETHVARDLVILVDTSGSMSGFPLTSAKLAATLLLESLGEADRFELVAFSDAPRPFAASPRSATKSAKREALAWLSALRAGGATEMHTAVIEAMRSLRPGSQRQVVIMTDGYIGGEEEIVRTLVETLPRSCRLHFVCAGSAANRSLALAMARAGRGTECTIAVGEDPERALARLMKGTAGPVLTDVTLSGSAVLESATEYLPDVFADSPLRIAAKLRAEGGELVVKGTSAEGTWEKRVTVPKTGHGEGDRGIVALFARECVEDLEMRMSYGHGMGRHGWQGHGGWDRSEGRGEGGAWPSFALRGLFSRLDTTPGQEKVIRQAAQEIFTAMAPLRGELDDTRKDIAKAVRTGTVDEVALGELFARHDEKLREARKAFIGALAKVNEALDEDQRKRLADMLDSGGHFESFGGPYRQGGGWDRGN